MQSQNNQPFGEVIASSLDSCTIQAWAWDMYPPYGALVAIQEAESTLIAIVHAITTAPLDTARMPIAYKKSDAELKAEHPHIFALLRTTLTVTTLGVKTGNHPQLILPVKPAHLHSFSCIDTQTTFAGTNSEAIRRIIALHEPQIADNLIHHYLLHQKSAGTLSGDYLRTLIAIYIDTVGNDYKRIFNLNRFIQTL